jgi:hypothetical protein
MASALCVVPRLRRDALHMLSPDGGSLIDVPFRRFYQTSRLRHLQNARPESSGIGGIGAGESLASHLFLLFYQVGDQAPISVRLPFPHFDEHSFDISYRHLRPTSFPAFRRAPRCRSAS